MSAAIYYLGLASLFTHELDAVTHAEWRLLFFLESQPDETASPLFVGLHVPLFFAILWLSHFPREVVRQATRVVVAAFLVVHAVLHFGNASNPLDEFDGTLSRTLIVSAAACGIAYLLAQLRGWRRTPPVSGRWG
jgi:UDP-N-acetylmuramyl pentapeptide phosphotransferase/UDP-N-acetylglucosamine-1-phosphate transferase